MTAVKNKVDRNYSFKDKNVDSFDVVETGNKTYIIPAGVGSTYWAILKVLFQNFEKKVYIDDLAEEVKNIMLDRDPDRWDEYVNKKHNNGLQKKMKPWEERIVGNAKTLTRTGGKSPYGLRLNELGYELVYKHVKPKAYFVLKMI